MSDGFDNDPIIIDISSDVTDAESARKALAAVDAEVKKLAADFSAGTVSFDHYLDGMDQLTARKGALNDWFASATTALKGTAEATAFNTNKLAVFAGTLDDLQYVPEMGLRPILNNLTQISPVLAVVGIAAQTLVSHFGGFAALVGEGHVRTAADEMRELGDKTQRTADEQQRLNKLTREQAVGKAIDEGLPEAVKKAQDAAGKAIIESDAPNLRRTIISRAPDLTADDPDLKAARQNLAENTALIAAKQKLADTSDDADQRLRAGRDLAAAQEYRAKLQQDLAKEEEAAAERFVKSVPINDNARKRLIDAIEKDADAFGDKGTRLAGDLKLIGEGKDPDAARKDQQQQADAARKKAEADDEKAMQERIRDAEKAADEKSRDYEKRAGELAKNLQGRFNVASARGGGDDAVDEGMIQAELAKAGLSEADARKYAGVVLGRLVDGYTREIEERAGKLGTDAAGAADAIVGEDDKKQADAAEKVRRDRDQMIDRARQGAEAAERDRADQLKRATAGTNLDGQTKAALMRSLLGGSDAESAIQARGRELAGGLTKQGMDPDAAGHAAEDYVREQMAKLQNEVGKGAMEGRGQAAEVKAPEQRDFLSFASSLTLGDIPKQSLDVQKQMLEQLVEVARKTGGAARVGP